MERKGFRELRVYQLSEILADSIWKMVLRWDRMAKRTVGEQLIRSADSIGANLAEGSGRGTYRDHRKFILIARASLYETQHWLRRAYMRGLLTKGEIQSLSETLNSLAPQLNAYLRSITKRAQTPNNQ